MLCRRLAARMDQVVTAAMLHLLTPYLRTHHELHIRPALEAGLSADCGISNLAGITCEEERKSFAKAYTDRLSLFIVRSSSDL